MTQSPFFGTCGNSHFNRQNVEFFKTEVRMIALKQRVLVSYLERASPR
jgi:hypothetical protein